MERARQQVAAVLMADTFHLAKDGNNFLSFADYRFD